MPDRCPKCLLPLATQDDYAREHPDECDVQAGTGDSCWCGRLCWEDEDHCTGDRGEALHAAALRLARAYVAMQEFDLYSNSWVIELDAALAAFRAVDAGDGAG